MKAPRGFVIVGQAQDLISNDDWGSPISEYPALMRVHNEAKDHGVAFPLKELSAHLIAAGLLKKPLAKEASDDFLSLLKVLLNGDFDVESEFWGRDMPGGSSFYVTAYLRTSKLEKVRVMLDASLQFLIAWRSQLQVTDRKKKRESLVQPVLPKEAEVKVADLAEQSWEDQLFEEILEKVKAGSNASFSRLNFLVHEGNIFYLETGWWHSIKGSPARVADRLKLLGISIVSVKVIKSSRGRIPYFGRRRAEELGCGWHEASIELDAGSTEANIAMAVARSNLAKE